jgi:HopA1 effector protein family
MNVGTVSLPAALMSALDDIKVSTDQLTATVFDRDLTADNPRELQSLLASTLYEVLHAGMRSEGTQVPRRLREAGFEQELAAAVPHSTTTVSAVVRFVPEQVTEVMPDVLVQWDGVRVWIPRDAIQTTGPWAPGQQVTLAVPPSRPALSPGFFLADGSAGGADSSETLRMYVHLSDRRSAASVWGRVLTHLEEHRTRYRAKVLSSSLIYPRRDALVVYLGPEAWQIIPGLAELVGGSPGVGEEVSVFCRRIGPGVAIAWEPDDARPAMRGLSFGQHRAGVLAQALLDSAGEGTARETAILTRFAESNIDPADPARNQTSSEAPSREDMPLF